MRGLLGVAAAAAVLAIGFLPFSECRKVPAPAIGLLSSSPVVLTQFTGDETFRNIACGVLQLIGPLPPSQSVKLTGAGWAGGRLEFLISQQGGGVDQTGDSATGMPLFLLSIVPPAESGEDGDPDAGKTLLTEFASSSGQEPVTQEISLPIVSADHGFMFVCSTDPQYGNLKCKVGGYDNKQEDATGKWKSTTLELPLRAGSGGLRFSIQGSRVRAPKLYATTGLKVSTEGAALGCRAEDATADHNASAFTGDELENEHVEEDSSAPVSPRAAAAEEA